MPVPLLVSVTCDSERCPRHGRQQRVALRRVAPGVVEIPRLLCAECECELLITWPTPGQEDTMPKITRHGGATNAAAARATPTPAAAAPTQGGERPSAGSSSETSTAKPPPTPEPSEIPRPPRARTTGSRSKKARAEGSTAPTTATAGPKTAGDGELP